MNKDDAEALVRTCLREIAPDSAFNEVPVDADYRDALALDSLDFLQLVELLSGRSSVRIDESDYPKLATIDGTVEFLTTAASHP